jgi:hypothetical protein
MRRRPMRRKKGAAKAAREVRDQHVETVNLRDVKTLDGRLYWMRQAHVCLGQDAIAERDGRTVMLVIDRAGPTVPILPASLSRVELRPSLRAFPLPNEKIDFLDQVGLRKGWYTRPDKPYRYLKHQYDGIRRDEFQPVLRDDRGMEWGQVIETYRVEIRQWLVG